MMPLNRSLMGRLQLKNLMVMFPSEWIVNSCAQSIESSVFGSAILVTAPGYLTVIATRRNVPPGAEWMRSVFKLKPTDPQYACGMSRQPS
jgi:hypothetical protein